METCSKQNKLVLFGLILIGIGIVLMVLFREELLGNLVRSLAYPIVIFSCFYVLKNPLIRLLESRLKGNIKDADVEVGLPKEVVDSLFLPEGRVTQENYMALAYLLACLAVNAAKQTGNSNYMLILNDSVSYLQRKVQHSKSELIKKHLNMDFLQYQQRELAEMLQA